MDNTTDNPFILLERTKDSSNWNKQQVKIAKMHKHIANVKSNYLHKLSTEIIKKHNIISMADL